MCACSLGMSSELLNRSAEHLCSNLSGYARRGKETDIWRDYGRMTMDVVGSVAFGLGFALFTTYAWHCTNTVM